MNRKVYWILRKKILTIEFKIKAFIYRIIDLINSNDEHKSFKRRILKRTIFETIKAMVLIFFILWLNGVVVKMNCISKIDDIPIISCLVSINKNIFASAVIGGIGVAGVILGLYCSSIASIYSSRFASAPRKIANAFQYDSVAQRIIYRILGYIIFGFLVLTVSMTKLETSWMIVFVFAFKSIRIVVSYSFAGNRAYQLSDIYGVAADSYQILRRVIVKRLNHKLFATDNNFQNHFLKIAEKQIDLLKAIQRYGVGINKKENADNSVMVDFLSKNLQLIELYWTEKKKIERTSLWFRNKPKYQRWHLASNTESSIALRTGTPLRTKVEPNYWWFEEELISINKNCLDVLIDQQDYSSIYTYLNVFNRLCYKSIECKEILFYVEHVNWIKQQLENRCISEKVFGPDRKAFVGVIEQISILYLELILESGRFYQEFDLERIFSKVIKSIDSKGVSGHKEYIQSSNDLEYYQKIIIEIEIEGRRITPDWVIKQHIAKEEYAFLNSILDIVREGVYQIFTLGKLLLDKKLYFESCIVLTRFYEYESKLGRFINVVEYRKTELESFHIDKELKWDEFRLQKLQNTINEWKISIPSLLFESSSNFILENWNNREEYPDFLGECFNHICEDAIEAIISKDIKQFDVDFENLSKIMLLYQEYIRTDFIQNKDLYRIEYAYYMFTSPIVEWAQIGGLAILVTVKPYAFRNNPLCGIVEKTQKTS